MSIRVQVSVPAPSKRSFKDVLAVGMNHFNSLDGIDKELRRTDVDAASQAFESTPMPTDVGMFKFSEDGWTVFIEHTKVYHDGWVGYDHTYVFTLTRDGFRGSLIARATQHDDIEYPGPWFNSVGDMIRYSSLTYGR